MQFFAKNNNGFHPLTIFAKSSILDVPVGSEYASGITCSQVLCRTAVLVIKRNVILRKKPKM